MLSSVPIPRPLADGVQVHARTPAPASRTPRPPGLGPSVRERVARCQAQLPSQHPGRAGLGWALRGEFLTAAPATSSSGFTEQMGTWLRLGSGFFFGLLSN